MGRRSSWVTRHRSPRTWHKWVCFADSRRLETRLGWLECGPQFACARTVGQRTPELVLHRQAAELCLKTNSEVRARMAFSGNRAHEACDEYQGRVVWICSGP